MRFLLRNQEPPNVQFKTRDELIPAIQQLLAERPEANLMIIVDGDAGMEVIQTHLSRIWSFGVLAATKRMLDAEYETLRNVR
jgi:hypothetical protein